MKSKRIFRTMAGIMAALTLAQSVSVTAFAAPFHNKWPTRPSQSQNQNPIVSTLDETDLSAQDAGSALHSGTVAFTGKEDAETVKEKLAAALLDEYEAGMYLGDIEFEYYCTGKNWSSATKKSWVTVNGTDLGSGISKYTYPALNVNTDGNYRIRLEDTTAEVTVTKTKAQPAIINTVENAEVALTYNDDGSLNFDLLREAILEQVVESSTPMLTTENTEIKYYATGKLAIIGTTKSEYRPLEGGSANGYEYPAISKGSQKIKITFNGNNEYASTEKEVTVNFTERQEANFTLNEGQTINLVYNEDLSVNYDAMYNAIRESVINSEMDKSALTIQYLAPYDEKLLSQISSIDIDKILNDLSANAWVPLEGGKIPYDLGLLGSLNVPYQALTKAGSYQIRVSYAGDAAIAPTSKEVTIIVSARPAINMELNSTEFALVYGDDLSVDYDTVRANILAVVKSDEVELTAENTTIEYYATAITGNLGEIGKAWMPLEGGKKDLLDYPAMGEDKQKIRVTYNGNTKYAKTTKEFTITISKRPEADFTLNEGKSVTLTYNDDVTVDYDALYQQIFDDVVVLGEKELIVDDVTIEYYATAKTGAVGELGKAWMPLEGGKKDLLEYPAMGEGKRTIRVTYAGDKDTAPTTKQVDITVLGRPELKVTTNDNVEVGFAFHEDMSYDYEKTAQNIIDAVIASADAENVAYTVAYNASLLSGIKDWKPLNNNDLTNLKKFGYGKWEIKISWAGTKDYKDGEVIVTVNMVDGRIESIIAVNDNVSFTYNMNAEVMKQAIWNNAINWDESTLPADITMDQVSMTYKALPKQLDDIVAKIPNIPNIPGLPEVNIDTITNALKIDVPVEGMTVSVKDIPEIGDALSSLLGDVQMLEYPAIGAGSNQEVTISFKGNSEYRPSSAVATVTVNKAKVTVNVQWTNIRAGQKMPENFITTNPADNFNVYTIYTGITSNVSLGIYLDLPETFTDGPIMKVVDPIVKGIFGKTLTQMLNDGMSVGELRQLFANEDLLNLLDKLGVDTSSLRQVLQALNTIAGIIDGTRVSFGTPTRAGLYSAIAITENKNYETGVGYGTILVRLNSSGVKLNWNQAINGTLTVEQAKEFDFGVTLSQDGDVTIDQSNVHYLYSGLTSKWRVYSSTTTPPTEPGSYVVTVVTLGGNYIAAPITRTFKIK